MELYKKLGVIYENVGYIQKSNQGKQYTYVGSSDVLAVVRSQMLDQKVILEPRIIDTNVREYSTKTGTTQLLTELDMTMTWVNIENPDEKIEIPWYAQGMDLAGEKGVGKALTYGEKYFLLKYFNIATDESDPDAFQEKAEAMQPPKKINEQQIKTLKEVIASIGNLVDQTPQQATKILLDAGNMPSKLQDINEHQYGGFLNYLHRTKKGYEKKLKEQQTAEQTSLMDGNTTTPKGDK